jgi:hypothetical protein
MRLLYRIYGDRNDVRNAVTYLDQEIRAQQRAVQVEQQCGRSAHALAPA